MTKSYLLGIDIGTSACKVAVFDRNGQVLAAANGDYPVYYPQEGWAEQNPEEWWSAVCKATKETIQKAGIASEEIAGVGIDGQSWSAIAIDKEGKVLTNTPIWMDTRAQSICDCLNEEIGADKIFEVAGNSLQPSYTTAKIIWYKENLPEVYANIYKILQSNSYIAFKLTDAITQDVSQGYGLHCFDMRKGCWDEEMCERLGIPMNFLPEICNCDHVVGTVTAKAAQECGLAEGTPVVAGGLDAACGTLGAGVIHPGETQEQGGQAGGMSICMDEYKADPRLILGYHVIPDKWLLQGGTTGGGGVMRWFEHEFADYERMMKEQTGESSLNQLNEIAEKVSPGCDGMVFLHGTDIKGDCLNISPGFACIYIFGIAETCIEGICQTGNRNGIPVAVVSTSNIPVNLMIGCFVFIICESHVVSVYACLVHSYQISAIVLSGDNSAVHSVHAGSNP